MKVIIVGVGEVGYHLAKNLSNEAKDVIIIDHDEEKISLVEETLDVQAFLGNGSSPAVLKEAGIEDADILVAVTDSDEVNMIACLIASSQTIIPKRIARIRNVEYIKNSKILSKDYLDLDLAINPEEEVVKNIIRLIEYPGAVDFVEFAHGQVLLIGLKLDEISYGVGKAVKDLSELRNYLKNNNKVLIVAISRDNRIIIPKGDTIIKKGDILYVMMEAGIAKDIISFFTKREERVKRVIVAGDSNISSFLANELDSMPIQSKLLCPNPDRCAKCSEVLDKVLVIQGDITDSAIMRDENIQDVDLFIAVSENESNNILSSLLAKRMGAKKVIALVNRIYYIPLVTTLGVDIAVSPHLAAISSILHFIRRGKVLSVAALKEGEAEVIETVALETSDIVNKPIKDIKFPKDAIIGAVVRGDDVIIPDGNDLIFPDDRVVIFAKKSAISNVEKKLMVKLEYF